MKQSLVIAVSVSLLAFHVGCGKKTNCINSTPAGAASHFVASQSKEIIAPNVLAVQLARHQEFESKTTFAPTEPIEVSLYLTDAAYIEPRRMGAVLVCDAAVVEEQNFTVRADEKTFDFRFAKTPRPSGDYQIRFIEIARSHGKPVLLARLFLKVE